MREILYIQAGNTSNYVGTHFWNTQECYMYSENPEIDPSISFCESNAQESSTLYPRLLTFDRKSNFGTLGDPNATETGNYGPTSLWGGELTEYRQEKIAKSRYQLLLDEGDELETAPRQTTTTSAEDQNQGIGEIRYWSDFSRLYYLPKSLQRIPDPADWETTNPNWTEGQEFFARYNEESELMDGALRLFVEDCDNLQGIQIINDTDTFGSFMSSFFASFRDEYHKLPSFAFPVLSGATTAQKYDGSQTEQTRQIVNEALYLRSLSDFSSISILIQDPKLWASSAWTDGDVNLPADIYHKSAVLSSHVESATIPFRLNSHTHDISSVCNQLNWRGTSPFGELCGIFPFFSSSSSDFQRKPFNFSSDLPINFSKFYARLDVTRGFSQNHLNDYENWISEHQSSTMFSLSHVRGPTYPLPNSFPTINISTPPSYPESPSLKTNTGELKSAPIYSSLSTSNNIGSIFATYASSLEKLVKTRNRALLSTDVTMDDLKELVNDIWTMHYNASENTAEVDL